MLILQKTSTTEIASVPTDGRAVEELLSKQWLLTNRRGGYASSTVVGCNTSRYHGLLIGSTNPLANRTMALANCVEMVILNPGAGIFDMPPNPNGARVFNLSTFEFNGKFSPEGFRHLRRFRRDSGAHFDYQLDKLSLTKSVYLLPDDDTVVLVYDVTNLDDFVVRKRHRCDAGTALELVLRPLVGLRDFHGLQKSYAPLCHSHLDGCLSIRHNFPGSSELFISCSAPMSFSKDKQWWFNFVYRDDNERGQDFMEDLWSPGFFKCRLDLSGKIVLQATLRAAKPMARVSNVPEQKTNLAKPKGEPTSENSEPPAAPAPDIEAVQKKLQKSCQNPKHGAKSSGAGQKNGNRGYEVLCLAADQFLARRRVKEDQRTTIIAGFPWFADWGRDVFVSLPGLLLLTGKTGEAKSVLTAFAQAADEGMIPNRFDDYGDTAYFNSIDASLWFIDASFRYLAATGDSAAFTQQLLPTIRWVVERYQKGTRFGIHADTDGLITGGDGSTQLTWMDAKCDGIAFTARGGKAVEVNALWYSSLRYLTQFYYDRDTETAKEYGNMAGKVAESFRCLFWNEQLGYLNDAVLSDGSVDATLRPNQIFAVSLPFSALSLEQQRSVVNEVEEKLLTPYGLRTLSPEDSRYRGQFTGPQRQRDEAYHQGTVWPYLMGPFVEAYLKVNEFSKKSKKRAAELIEPLLKHLTDDGCLGQISEIFDGDPPHRPRGCFAQAWSVAELIRAYRLIHG